MSGGKKSRWGTRANRWGERCGEGGDTVRINRATSREEVHRCDGVHHGNDAEHRLTWPRNVRFLQEAPVWVRGQDTPVCVFPKKRRRQKKERYPRDSLQVRSPFLESGGGGIIGLLVPHTPPNKRPTCSRTRQNQMSRSGCASRFFHNTNGQKRRDVDAARFRNRRHSTNGLLGAHGRRCTPSLLRPSVALL